MKTAQKILAEIEHLHEKINSLERSLQQIQHQCQHHFVGDSYYKKCTKCHKVEVLYY